MLVENEMKKLRSPACSRQTKRNFFTQFLKTWEEPFSAALNPFNFLKISGGLEGA